MYKDCLVWGNPYTIGDQSFTSEVEGSVSRYQKQRRYAEREMCFPFSEAILLLFVHNICKA